MFGGITLTPASVQETFTAPGWEKMNPVWEQYVKEKSKSNMAHMYIP